MIRMYRVSVMEGGIQRFLSGPYSSDLTPEAVHQSVSDWLEEYWYHIGIENLDNVRIGVIEVNTIGKEGGS